MKLSVFCCSATLMSMRRTSGNCSPVLLLLFYETKLCLRKLIFLLSFSQYTPLHSSAWNCHLEVTRLLVESKADVAARDRCFSPPPSHHLSLTICLAAVATLHSNTPSNSANPTLLHTCAASARRNDAHPPRCHCPNKTSSCSCRRGGGGSFKKYKRKLLIRTSQCVTVPVLMYAPLVHAVATALARPADADLFC